LFFRREAQAREERKSLLRRLEEAEGRNEELAQSVSVSTRPLLKQIEMLQSNCNQQRDCWEEREKQLLEKLGMHRKKYSGIPCRNYAGKY